MAARPHTESIATTNENPHPVSAPIAGLSAGTTYHWQLCVNDHDPDTGLLRGDQTFTTKAAGGSRGSRSCRRVDWAS